MDYLGRFGGRLLEDGSECPRFFDRLPCFDLGVGFLDLSLVDKILLDLDHCCRLILLLLLWGWDCRPFLLHVPSGRLSGPTLNPVRGLFGCDAAASSSRGLLGAIASSFFLSCWEYCRLQRFSCSVSEVESRDPKFLLSLDQDRQGFFWAVFVACRG